MSDSAEIEMMAEGLAFLQEHGFRLLRAERLASEALGRMCSVEYFSAAACRVVAVTYFADVPSAHTLIRRADEQFTFADAGSMVVREPSFAEAPGECLDKLTNYLLALKRQLSSRYLGILVGGSFSNDAFDWSPYK